MAFSGSAGLGPRSIAGSIGTTTLSIPYFIILFLRFVDILTFYRSYDLPLGIFCSWYLLELLGSMRELFLLYFFRFFDASLVLHLYRDTMIIAQ